MALKIMYPAQKDSPSTILLGDVTGTDTLFTLGNAAVLPQTVPYPLTLGVDKKFTEVVMVTSINLVNNQITVVRPEGAYAWPAGTMVARVFNASDLNDLQDNIEFIGGKIEDIDNDVIDLQTNKLDKNLETNVVYSNDEDGSPSGIVFSPGPTENSIAQRTSTGALRASDPIANNDLTTKQFVENLTTSLNTSKVNRTELPQVITDWVYSADGTKLLVTITRYNANTQQVTEFTKTIPLITDTAVGMMTPEAYNEITALRNDVLALQQQGGRFIGISFASKSGLDSYNVPPTVRAGDFTYVLDDETYEYSTTRYVYNGAEFEFAFVVNYDPVGLADGTTPGIVKSSGSNGKVFVESDGTMSVVGWDAMSIEVQEKIPLLQKSAAGGVPVLNDNIKVLPEQISTKVVPVLDSKILALQDAGTMQKCTNISDIIFTIPENETVSFPIDTQIEICKEGIGLVYFVAESGATVNAMDDVYTVSKLHQKVRLKKIDVNVWLLEETSTPPHTHAGADLIGATRSKSFGSVGANHLNFVVPLIKLDNVPADNQYFSGTVFMKLLNGGDVFTTLHLSVQKKYDAETPEWSGFVNGTTPENLIVSLVTFTYNSVKYFGVKVHVVGPSYDQIVICGSASDWDIIDQINYYDTNASEVLSAEINDSLALAPEPYNSALFPVSPVVRPNGSNISYKIWNENNDGADSGLDADKLDGKHASDFVETTRTINGQSLGTDLNIPHIGGLVGRTAIPSGTDFNELTTAGRYFVASGTTGATMPNYPIPGSGGFVDVVHFNANTLQICYGWGSSYTARWSNAGTWGLWELNVPGQLGLRGDGLVMRASGGWAGSPLTLTGGDTNGALLKIQGGGMTVIGSGEAPTTLINAEALPDTSENLHLCADGTLTLWTACNTIANRKAITVSTAGAMVVPSHTDYTTAKARNIRAGTGGMTAGTTTLANGDIYLQYE